MKKHLLLITLCAPFALTAMDVKKEQSISDILNQQAEEGTAPLFAVIKEKFAAGTLRNTDVRDAIEQMIIKKVGHPTLRDRIIGRWLEGTEGNNLFAYLQSVAEKVRNNQPLTDSEREQAKAIYQLVHTFQNLKESGRFRNAFSRALIKALSQQ